MFHQITKVMFKNISSLLIVFMLVACSGNKIYKDGTYNGVSRSKYTNEPFYAFTTIRVNDGLITHISFHVRDSVQHVTFDHTYEKNYAGIPEYIQQCRNDWKGIQAYPDSLLKHQLLNKVDGISGATWSYNLFKASAQEALRDAKIAK